MSETLRIPKCASCGQAVWPARLLCPACHCADWEPIDAGEGALEELTELSGQDGPYVLGTVRLDAGPVVIARCEGAEPGERVRMQIENGALVARMEDRR
jgi:uncharacterized protein